MKASQKKTFEILYSLQEKELCKNGEDKWLEKITNDAAKTVEKRRGQ